MLVARCLDFSEFTVEAKLSRFLKSKRGYLCDVYHISSKKVDHWRDQDPRYKANADRRFVPKYKEKTKLTFSSSSVGVFRPKKNPSVSPNEQN